MNVLHEIIEWAQNLPGWQADAVRRLLRHGELDDKDESEILAMLRSKYQILPKAETAPLAQRPSRIDASAANGRQRDVRLVALRDLTNVNAIAANQELQFGISGVTVVYGRNASGKSGYARVLKRACRARDTNERIHPNLFGGATAATPSAVFDLEVDGQADSVTWQEDESCPDELGNFAVFDARCARIYVDEKNDVSYVPYGMDIFQKLVGLCNQFRDLMVKEKNAINPRPSFLGEFDTRVDTGRVVAEVSANTSSALIRQRACISDKEKRRFQELSQFLKRAEVESPKTRASALRRLKARILKLKQDIESATHVLSDGNIGLLKSLQAKMKQTAEVARVASEEAFMDMPLKGVGGEPWRALFEAARLYSESHAYLGVEFPVIESGARCVLCQQVLDDKARERFQQFKNFVTEQTATAAETARCEFESSRASFLAAKVDVESRYEELLKEIEEQDAALATQLRQLLAALKPRHEAIGQALKTGAWNAIPKPPLFALAALDDLANKLENQAEACESAGEPQELEERQREHAELTQRMLAARHLSDILTLIENLKHRNRLDKCIEGLHTRGITLKNSKLMDMVTTEALREALEREFRAFDIQRLRVSLDKSGSKGITFHQLRFSAPTDSKVPLSEILSEGEHRVVAIASFLAELSTTPGSCGIVFDDPVCSLDHAFRKAVAKRLVQEGKNRQVIIFTHDIVFLLDLTEQAVTQQVALTGQEIRRAGQEVGTCRDALPWEAQSVKKRIGELRKLLQEDIKKSNHSQDLYVDAVKRFYCLLRETWERAVEEVLLNDVLQRFRPSVQTLKLKEVIVSDEDYARVHQGMEKCSALMAGHDTAPAVNHAPPSMDELRDDLDEIDSFVSEISKRRNNTQKARHAALKPQPPA